ncbi:MAG: hypothetical protein DWI22_22450, partial [Planctomycetota bacterium]
TRHSPSAEQGKIIDWSWIRKNSGVLSVFATGLRQAISGCLPAARASPRFTIPQNASLALAEWE